MRKLNKYDKELEEAWAAATEAATWDAAAWATRAATWAAAWAVGAARADELEHQIEMTLKVL